MPNADNVMAVPIIPAILSAMPDHRINLHLVSDATGETLNAIARATTVQFEHVSCAISETGCAIPVHPEHHHEGHHHH